jgi:hypothetical protein
MTDRRLAEFQRPRDIAARADQHHQWALPGSPRGTYVDPDTVGVTVMVTAT